MPTYTFKIAEESIRERLDVFLTKNIPDIPSRTFVQKMIENGEVKVNGQMVKSHYKMNLNDDISVVATLKETPPPLAAQEMVLDIFYEDDDLVVLNKPVGVSVHPGVGCRQGTLVNGLLFHYQSLSDVNDPLRPGIVHRLDKETSGLLLVAKNNLAHVRLSRQFEKRKIKKRYVALVEGSVEFDEGLIDAAVGRDPRHFDRKKVVVEGGKEAQTAYRVLKRMDQVTLVALFPTTGRTHQLRVHMAHIRHPILGDEKYGKKHSFPRLALHAQGLKFAHPRSGEFLEFSLALPKEFTL